MTQSAKLQNLSDMVLKTAHTCVPEVYDRCEFNQLQLKCTLIFKKPQTEISDFFVIISPFGNEL